MHFISFPVPGFAAPRRTPLLAEAATPPGGAGLSRRGLVGACACCFMAAAFGPGLALADVAPASANDLHARLDVAARNIEGRMIGWRRGLHQQPELGNQETRTAGLVAEHLRRLGYYHGCVT